MNRARFRSFRDSVTVFTASLIVVLAASSSPAGVSAAVETYRSGSTAVSVDVFAPSGKVKPGGPKRPAVVMLHGSGGLDPGTAGAFRGAANTLAKGGYVVLIPHYFDRTDHVVGESFREGEYEAWVESIGDAINFAIERGDVDEERIGLLGMSLGGGLMTQYVRSDPRVKALVALSSAVPVPGRSKIPTLVLLGSKDPGTPKGYSDRFREMKEEDKTAPHALHLYQGMAHNPGPTQFSDASRRAVAFFDKHVKKASFLRPAVEITHSFLATGGETYIRAGDGKILWSYPHPSRDGWVLPDGNVLLALSPSKDHPHGAVVEVTREGKTLFSYEGTQSEVNTVQPLEGGNILYTEAGDKPRLIEITRGGRIMADIPIKAQTRDHHLQTRMARKLPDGHYLVPQLLDKVVREYTPRGEIAWEVSTPNMPFTAIRLDDGNTLIGCTLGDLVVEVNPRGETVWKLTNDDLPGKPINDACGVQRLPNGNTVVTSHHAKGDEVRLTEVNREKKPIWLHRDPSKPGIHHFQILDTDGKPLEGKLLR